MSSYKTLLDFIGYPESQNNYNRIVGLVHKVDYPRKPLTQMTIRQVLDWQDSIDPKYKSEAAGKYQIMEDTLRPTADTNLPKAAGLTMDSLFDEKGQDALAIALLRRRGLDRYLSGSLTAEAFANNLAKEWASLPQVSGPRKGFSVYAGDGLNKAHVTVDNFMAAVKSIRSAPLPTPPKPVRIKTWFERMLDSIFNK